MKIALLTIWHVKNYGAELQAFSTIKILQDLGHEVELIEFCLGDSSKLSLSGILANTIESFSPCHRKFDIFWKKNFPRVKKYDSMSELQRNPPKADVYMVGSDQVWNPDITKNSYPIFFLDFGSEDVKRVSYASSFGVPVWKYPKYTEQIKTLLRRFSGISCREKSGSDILWNTFGIKAETVVDPTLLYNNFGSLVKPHKKDNKLVCYPLGDDVELVKYAKSLSKKLGFHYVDATNNKKILYRIIWNRNSIEEWITAIACADIVITRSFHGMLFSIMHRKNFIILANQKGRSSRLTDFMETIGLSNRFFETVEDIEKSKIWEQTINYDIISPKIESLRNHSLSILKIMLSDA